MARLDLVKLLPLLLAEHAADLGFDLIADCANFGKDRPQDRHQLRVMSLLDLPNVHLLIGRQSQLFPKREQRWRK